MPPVVRGTQRNTIEYFKILNSAYVYNTMTLCVYIYMYVDIYFWGPKSWELTRLVLGPGGACPTILVAW